MNLSNVFKLTNQIDKNIEFCSVLIKRFIRAIWNVFEWRLPATTDVQAWWIQFLVNFFVIFFEHGICWESTAYKFRLKRKHKKCAARHRCCVYIRDKCTFVLVHVGSVSIYGSLTHHRCTTLMIVCVYLMNVRALRFLRISLHDELASATCCLPCGNWRYTVHTWFHKSTEFSCDSSQKALSKRKNA